MRARLRCWLRLSHAWPPRAGWRELEAPPGEPARCARCGKVLARRCDLCGKVHDMRGCIAFSCTVVRGGWQ